MNDTDQDAAELPLAGLFRFSGVRSKPYIEHNNGEPDETPPQFALENREQTSPSTEP